MPFVTGVFILIAVTTFLRLVWPTTIEYNVPTHQNSFLLTDDDMQLRNIPILKPHVQSHIVNLRQ